MKTEFKLVGLSRPQLFTCETFHNDEVFYAKNGLGISKFNELWNYCKGNWADRKIAEIEHDGYLDNGTPKNPIVINIREIIS